MVKIKNKKVIIRRFNCELNSRIMLKMEFFQKISHFA